MIEKGTKKKPLVLRSVISFAINLLSAPGAKQMTAEEKNKAYQLSVKVWSKKEVNFTVDQLALIKKRVGEVYNPLVYGRVCDILEGNSNEKSEDQKVQT